MGWFFGFKLHLIINDKGEILNFMFTPGNVDDREPLKQAKFVEILRENYAQIKDISDRICLKISFRTVFSLLQRLNAT